jgi:hypothetical protein
VIVYKVFSPATDTIHVFQQERIRMDGKKTNQLREPDLLMWKRYHRYFFKTPGEFIGNRVIFAEIHTFGDDFSFFQ